MLVEPGRSSQRSGRSNVKPCKLVCRQHIILLILAVCCRTGLPATEATVVPFSVKEVHDKASALRKKTDGKWTVNGDILINVACKNNSVKPPCKSPKGGFKVSKYEMYQSSVHQQVLHTCMLALKRFCIGPSRRTQIVILYVYTYVYSTYTPSTRLLFPLIHLKEYPRTLGSEFRARPKTP